jgi:hypothetical protein
MFSPIPPPKEVFGLGDISIERCRGHYQKRATGLAALVVNGLGVSDISGPTVDVVLLVL